MFAIISVSVLLRFSHVDLFFTFTILPTIVTFTTCAQLVEHFSRLVDGAVSRDIQWISFWLYKKKIWANIFETSNVSSYEATTTTTTLVSMQKQFDKKKNINKRIFRERTSESSLTILLCNRIVYFVGVMCVYNRFYIRIRERKLFFPFIHFHCAFSALHVQLNLCLWRFFTFRCLVGASW